MAKTTTKLFARPDYSLHRSVAAADTADLDALRTISAIPPGGGSPVAQDRRDIVDCAGWETVSVFAEFTGGTTPDVDIQLVEDAGYEDEDGATQTNFVASLDTPPFTLTDRVAVDVPVYGGRWFFRVAGISGSPTLVNIYVAGARRMQHEPGQLRKL